MLRQHKLNRHMVFAEHSSNLMQGLPSLPAPPHLIPLLLRELEPPLRFHKHHLIEKRFIMVLRRPVELAHVCVHGPQSKHKMICSVAHCSSRAIALADPFQVTFDRAIQSREAEIHIF
jgi:hypothetical protein